MSNNVSDNEITKSFGTILTDNTHVKAQAARYKQEKKMYLKVMPKIFNPFDTWGNFLSDIKNQGKCGACFAYSICGSFNDRLAIMTLGQSLLKIQWIQNTLKKSIIKLIHRVHAMEVVYILVWIFYIVLGSLRLVV